MSAVVSLAVENGVGIITIDSPPVNALGAAVRAGLLTTVGQAIADDQVRAMVLICAGRTFVAGADISEFGKPPQAPGFNEVMEIIEKSHKPSVAAIHGTALGGGLELAMVCNFRVAVRSARLGLPEVHLGLLPGAGGTQRLPRLVGVEVALEMMLSGKPIDASRALELGLLDSLAAEGQLRSDSIAFARQILAAQRPLRRARDLQDKVAALRGKPEFFAACRKANSRAFRGFRAPELIVQAVEAAVNLPFDQGLAREQALFTLLLASPESAAQRYAFFAERESSKIPDLAADTPTLPVKTVGVIGAGTMGGGITMNFLNAGIPVTLVEANKEALDRGVGVIRRNYETTVKKGRLTPAELEQRMALLTPSLEMTALSRADLIIEAVFESLPLKKDIFAKLSAIARPDAILASNTSYLDVNEIAAMTDRPAQVLGLHFFSPANVMRLLEIVRAAKTSKPILATALKLARQIGKVPVVAGVCHGFIANRAMTVRSDEANQMILEGTSFAAIDRAIYHYGFAMGPFQMADLVGLDVIGRDSPERTVAGDLVARERLGQKKNGGFYDYDTERRATPSALAQEIIAAVAQAQGIKPSPLDNDDDVVARLLYRVVNEGAKILEEGIAIRASDIDMACVLGYNWPVYTGGPMHWANTVGLPRVVATLQTLQSQHGERFRPAALLAQLAADGKTFK